MHTDLIFSITTPFEAQQQTDNGNNYNNPSCNQYLKKYFNYIYIYIYIYIKRYLVSIASTCNIYHDIVCNSFNTGLKETHTRMHIITSELSI